MTDSDRRWDTGIRGIPLKSRSTPCQLLIDNAVHAVFVACFRIDGLARLDSERRNEVKWLVVSAVATNARQV